MDQLGGATGLTVLVGFATAYDGAGPAALVEGCQTAFLALLGLAAAALAVALAGRPRPQTSSGSEQD